VSGALWVRRLSLRWRRRCGRRGRHGLANTASFGFMMTRLCQWMVHRPVGAGNALYARELPFYLSVGSPQRAR